MSMGPRRVALEMAPLVMNVESFVGRQTNDTKTVELVVVARIDD